MANIDELWERHKNPISWVLRPIFGFLMFYGAWIHSLLLIAFSIFGLSTSWFWFPKPQNPYPWVETFIDIEREYLTPPWNFKKISGLLFVAVFIVVVNIAFWKHDAITGLWIFVFGALLKSAWSILVAKRAGLPAALIGIFSALFAGLLLFMYSN